MWGRAVPCSGAVPRLGGASAPPELKPAPRYTKYEMGAPGQNERAVKQANSLPPVTTNGVLELASSPDVRECLQWFQREKQWINDRHVQVCRVPP